MSYEGWEGETGRWNFSWRREWFVWELEVVDKFLNIVKSARMGKEEVDMKVWKRNTWSIYNVKLRYSFCSNH